MDFVLRRPRWIVAHNNDHEFRVIWGTTCQGLAEFSDRNTTTATDETSEEIVFLFFPSSSEYSQLLEP